MHNRPPVRQQFGYQGNIRKYYWPCAHPFSNSWSLPSILTIVQVSSPKKRGLFAHLHICCSSCCCVDMGVDVCTTSCDLPMQVERGRDLYFEETSSNCCSLSPSPPDRHPHRTCKQILPCMQESLAKEASHHTFVYSVFFLAAVPPNQVLIGLQDSNQAHRLAVYGFWYLSKLAYELP